MMVVGDDSGNLRLYNVRDLTNRKSESSDDILKPSRVCFKICLTSSIFIGVFFFINKFFINSIFSLQILEWPEIAEGPMKQFCQKEVSEFYK